MKSEYFAKKFETPGKEQCWTKFSLTDTNLDEGTFRGIASVFGSMVQSWMPTVIEPGAFTKTLQENGQRVKLLWQHDPYTPIGVPTSLMETQAGLEITGRISQTQAGKDALTLMRDGVIDELSIGFDPIRYEMEETETEKIRHIKEVRLWEISPVTFAADPLAKIQAVHALAPFRRIAEAFDEIALIYEELLAAWTLQTLVFPKSKWDLAGAKKWCSDHDYKTGVDETDDSYRFRQRNPGDFERLRTICFDPSRDTAMDACRIKAIGGPLKEGAAVDITNLDLLARMPLEAQEGKVLSGKNKKLLQDALAVITALLAAAEPPVKEPEKDDKQALTVNMKRINSLRDAQMAFAHIVNSNSQ